MRVGRKCEKSRDCERAVGTEGESCTVLFISVQHLALVCSGCMYQGLFLLCALGEVDG
jgi:hypothetical protein